MDVVMVETRIRGFCNWVARQQMPLPMLLHRQHSSLPRPLGLIQPRRQWDWWREL